MFDFASNINQSMQIVLAYTGRLSYFGVSLTQFIIALVVLPWGIYLIQGLWKTFSPVPVDFDPVTGSIYDPDWHDERDKTAVDNYVNGIYDPESSGAIGRYRQQQNRRKKINPR